MTRIVAALALLLITAACAITAPPGPPEWQAAFVDGCNSGGNTMAIIGREWVRDDRAYEDEKGLYRRGWDEGFKICTDQAKAHYARSGFMFGVVVPVR